MGQRVGQVGGKKEVLQRTFNIEFKAQLPRGFSYYLNTSTPI
jgi:hypothetical protein